MAASLLGSVAGEHPKKWWELAGNDHRPVLDDDFAMIRYDRFISVPTPQNLHQRTGAVAAEPHQAHSSIITQGRTRNVPRVSLKWLGKPIWLDLDETTCRQCANLRQTRWVSQSIQR